MSGSSAQAESLERFLRANGAHLHPSIAIVADNSLGYHWRAKDNLEAGSTVISVPHSIAFSYLNALVDEDWPLFKKHRQNFQPDFEVEAISFFYLMIQYVNRDKSFWRPYLDALPGPELEHTQPLFYQDSEDIEWLEGTDVWHTNEKRIKRYREIYDDGLRVLQEAACDVSWCTWDLFNWAAAIYTSRSFSSRALRPHDSKYWAAYRHGKDGQSQTILIDMSHASSSDFPVLFPGLDIGNHSNDAKIDYIFDPGRFDIKTNTAARPGDEVFNNYGPKGNDELLLGYGFCIPQNPHNTVPLMLKAPPQELQRELRNVHPGYFLPSQGADKPEWNTEKTTFQLSRPGDLSHPEEIFRCLPEPLIELLVYVLHHERGYAFTFIEHPRDYLTSGDGRRYLPHVANIMIQSLIAKLYKLEPDGLPKEPKNAKQRQAAIYKDDQRSLIGMLLKPFQQYLQSLLAFEGSKVFRGPCLVRLETFIQLAELSKILPARFMDGVEANANTRDAEQLVLAGWEQDIWILLSAAFSIADGQKSPFGELPAYMNMNAQYLEAKGSEIDQDPEHPSHGLMELVRQAASACPGSMWSSPLWTAARLCEHAKRLEFDGFVMPLSDDDGDEGPRFCVYLHGTLSAAESQQTVSREHEE